MSNPPRRSTRAASAKPEQQQATKNDKRSKPAARATSRSAKRPASPEPPAPPSKRSKVKAKADFEEKPKENKVAAKPAITKSPTLAPQTVKNHRLNNIAAPHRSAELYVQKMAPFNPLPHPPDHTRPAPQLFAWGAGNFGQFGMGPDHLGEFSKPKRNLWMETKMEEGAFGGEGAGLEEVAAGGLHTLFLDEKGTVWSCGVNDDAALGRITKDVPDPNNPGAFLDIDELTSIPHPLQSLVDEGFRAVRIVAGDSISAALSSYGDLRVWGSFRAVEGSLGFSDHLKHQFLPIPILRNLGQSEKVASIASGNNHLVVLTTEGNIYTWGAGEQGQLGRKVLERRKIHGTVPERIILGNRSRKARVVGTGNYHSFAVDEDGDVWGWGLNTMGQTGTGVTKSLSASSEVQVPKKVTGLSTEALGGSVVVQIVGGEHHTLFMTSSGKVYACGRCDGGQLGLTDDNPEFKDREHPDFVAKPLLVRFPDEDDPVVHISSGTHNNMAVTQGGALYAWGEETQGELGVGEQLAKTPTVVVRRQGGSFHAVAVSCGGQHTLGLFRKRA